MNKELKNKLKRLKLKKEQEKLLFKEDRYINILHFLRNKGLLLVASELKVIRNKKIDIKDVLTLGELEPRVIEVFPAAFIRFERKFKNTRAIPRDLGNIIDELREGLASDHEFMGVKQKDMLRWCNSELKDGRSKPLNKKKILTSFKLSPEIFKKLEELSENSALNKTQIVESLIMKA